MESAALTTSLVVCAVNLVAGAFGAWRWWTVTPSRAFWFLARAGQAGSIALAALAGVAYVTGARPDDGLFWLYALLPVAIGLFAEQFRLLSAQTVLDARGLPDAEAMRALSEREQRSVVLAIVRREIGVITAAALVVAFLATRAGGLAAGL